MSREHWGMGGIYLRNRIWWVHYSVNGIRYNESTKTTDERKARSFLKKRLQEAGSGELRASSKFTTVSEILDLVIEDYEHNAKDIKWATTLIESHLRPFFKNLRADAFGTEHYRGYVAHRKRQGRQNATINNELALLRRAFTLGAQAKPPMVSTRPLIKKLEARNVRTGFFEHDEYIRLRDELPPEIKPILTFAYYTGCRRGEILKIEWSQVDLENRVVRLDAIQTKGRKARTVPLVSELVDMLAAMKRERNTDWPYSKWVFSRGGERIRSFKNAWEAACKRAGVDRLFHDTRRTGVRNLIRAGVPEKTAMLISGHKTRSVFDRYNIVDERDLHDAAKKLEERMKR